MKNIKELPHELEKFNVMFLELKGKYRFSRLGKTFETKNKKYFLDSGTGKIFCIEDDLYKILECFCITNEFEQILTLGISFDNLLKALNELKDAVENENILQRPVLSTMHYNNGDKNDDDITNTQIKHISIELTEKCNLRCKYCVYNEGECGFRTFGKKDITIDIIKKAIDLISLSAQKEIYISFYGGEPLLKFDLIKKCVEYSNEKLIGKKIIYNMTTNATLITDEIATYLASLKHYFTTISLDGPELIHNKNRVFIDGTGSFNKTISGLKKLVKAEGENASERINFNIVLDDTSLSNFEKIQEFFNTAEYIPKGSTISTSYIESKPVEFQYLGVDTKEDKELTEIIKDKMDPLTEWNLKKVNSKEVTLDGNTLISRDFVDKGLDTIHSRMLIDKPAQIHYMNGCCIPGGRRLYLTVNGDFSVCERIGPSPFIGNVDTGIDFEKIKKYYINDFINEAAIFCNDCWAVHMCKLCYTNCYKEDGIHMPYRHLQCVMHRQSIYKDLKIYHDLLENSPDELAYLEGIKYS